MSKFAAMRDAGGNILGVTGTRSPVAGLKTKAIDESVDAETDLSYSAGESKIKFQGATGVVKRNDTLVFSGHAQVYTVLPTPYNNRTGPDSDDRTVVLRVSPDLVEHVYASETITHGTPTPEGRVVLTDDQYVETLGPKHHPGTEKPKWHITDDGTLTANKDDRRRVRFSESSLVADVDDVLTVKLEVLTGSPATVDVSFTDKTLDLSTNRGDNLRVPFTDGVGTLNINTSKSKRYAIQILDKLRLVAPLFVRIRSGENVG